VFRIKTHPFDCIEAIGSNYAFPRLLIQKHTRYTETSYAFLSLTDYWGDLLNPGLLCISLTANVRKFGSDSLFILDVGAWRTTELAQMQDGKWQILEFTMDDVLTSHDRDYNRSTSHLICCIHGYNQCLGVDDVIPHARQSVVSTVLIVAMNMTFFCLLITCRLHFLHIS
jgi:hypothetical protein